MSNNIKKFNEEFLLESQLYTKSKVDDITSIYNSLSSIYDDVNSILYNNDDFEKVKETLFKQYDVKNNSDLIKDYFNDYLKTNEKILQENLKLLFNSYDLYKKNLLNLKVKSNIIENKSELVFKNVNFDYVFNKSKKTKNIKENLKYDIGTHLMNIIFYNNQNGGFFSNRNKNTNKKNNYKINFKKVNEINDYDDYKFDDNDDLDSIVKFYQKNINDFKKKEDQKYFNLSQIFFPYYINIINGLVGNHDFYILNDEYNIYEFSKNAIKYLEKKEKGKNVKNLSRNYMTMLGGEKKKQSKNSPKKNKKESGSKNNPPYNFNKILKSIKELKSNNEFSQYKFDEIKDKLFRLYYNFGKLDKKHIISSLSIINDNNRFLKNPFCPLKIWDDKYIEDVLKKHDDNIYNNFIKYYESLSDKSKSIVTDFHTFLNNESIILSHRSEQKIIEKLIEKHSKKKGKKKGKKGGAEYDKIKEFYNQLNILQICYFYDELNDYKSNDNKSNNSNIINFKENIRLLNFYLKIEICKYYIYVSYKNLLNSFNLTIKIKKIYDQYSLGNLSQKINIKNTINSLKKKNKNNSSNENKNKENQKKEKKFSKEKENIFNKIDEFCDIYLKNVNKNSLKYKSFKNKIENLKKSLENKNNKESEKIVHDYFKKIFINK
jgi:hypothetical protein